MSKKPFVWIPHKDILSYEEMFFFVKMLINEGIRKVRITGGEPLTRANTDRFVKMIKEYNSDMDIALTTNGYLLEDMAEKLSHAGLKRVNVSLDSLKKDTIYQISKTDALNKILSGIDKAISCGIRIKLNTVPIVGVNDKEILDIFDYAKKRGIMVRFIEYMENGFADNLIKGLSLQDIIKIISSKYIIREVDKEHCSPARLFKTEDGYCFGVIAPHNHDFCKSCNRIRLSAEGFLIPCLYFDEAISIKDAVRSGDEIKLKEILNSVLQNKPEKNCWNKNGEKSAQAFYKTGG
jgi:cyclic pyranopterin phosphate synthase